MKFLKVQASGNDFILIDTRYSKKKLTKSFYRNFARKYCPRSFAIGADGILVIEKSKKANFKMRIFNADGSEAEMCGNGTRCVGLWAAKNLKKKEVSFETIAGIITAKVSDLKQNNATVKINMPDPLGLKQDILLDVSKRKLRVDFVDSGVPHAVLFVDCLEKIDVDGIGRKIRTHKKFSPKGTNVNFVEEINRNKIKIRTYERGVEAETFACGTGMVASAILTVLRRKASFDKKVVKMQVKPKGDELIKVYFRYNEEKRKLYDVWFEGKAFISYEGKISI